MLSGLIVNKGEVVGAEEVEILENQIGREEPKQKKIKAKMIQEKEGEHEAGKGAE